MNRKLLAIDTSTGNMTVALLDGARVLGEHDSAAERNHSILLVPAIEALFAEVGLDKRELGGIAVGQGPGSYTGVRIGVTVGKMMAWALGVPIVGVSSLEALALSAVADDAEAATEPASASQWVTPVLDARRGQAYTALFETTAAMDSVRLAEDGIRIAAGWLESLADRVAEGGTARWRVVGETVGFAHVLDAISARGVPVETAAAVVRASEVGRLGLRQLLTAGPADAHRLVPNYTQLAEAEAKLLSRRKQGYGE